MMDGMGRGAPPSMNGLKAVSLDDALSTSVRDDDAARLKRLAIGPENPAWKFKIQPPEPDGLTVFQNEPAEDLTASILQRMREMSPAVSPAASASPVTAGGRRVAFYYGRDSDYIVCVESAPEGDILKRFKLSETEAKAVFNVCRAFGIYLKDVTGEFDEPELREDNAGAPARPRRGRPRREKDEAPVSDASKRSQDAGSDGAAA